MTRNQRVGKWGEDAAAAFLLQRGFEILERNLRTPHGEIDILARSRNLWVFVEVKTRTSMSWGPPEIAVGPRKQAHLRACAEYYTQLHAIDHWRIDVIAVERAGAEPRIRHFENAVA